MKKIVAVLITILGVMSAPSAHSQQIAIYKNAKQIVLMNYMDQTGKKFVDIYPAFEELTKELNYPYIVHLSHEKYGPRIKLALQANPDHDPAIIIDPQERSNRLIHFRDSFSQEQQRLIVTVVGVNSEFICAAMETQTHYYKLIASEEIYHDTGGDWIIRSDFGEFMESVNDLKAEELLVFARMQYMYPMNWFDPCAPYYDGPPAVCPQW